MSVAADTAVAWLLDSEEPGIVFQATVSYTHLTLPTTERV